MKAAIYLSLVATALAAVQKSATNEISAESICGELGVMSFNASELPNDVSPNEVRLCAKHPQGRNRTLDFSEGASLPPVYINKQGLARDTTDSTIGHLNERSCYDGAPYGCSEAATAIGGHVDLISIVAFNMISLAVVVGAGINADAAASP
ncbi:hypothetical protein ACQKWADRAFT_309983 [Trichoderma austrokoningii]